MQARMQYAKTDPAARNALLGLEAYLEQCGLEESLLDLIRIRVSQINGCAYCIDMHTKDARASGETEQRIYALSGWEETPFYTERERAALAWAESVTLLNEGHVPDAVYEQARQQFSDKELISLTMAMVGMNAWNRMNVAFRTVPGLYQTKRTKAAHQDTAPVR